MTGGKQTTNPYRQAPCGLGIEGIGHAARSPCCLGRAGWEHCAAPLAGTSAFGRHQKQQSP